MKYLVADDDPLVCETVDSFLQRLDDTEFCLKAGDGLTALQVLSAGGIDAVFLDLQMPGLNGPDVLRALPRDIPIVLISASAEFGAESYEFQVTDYLVKPLAFPRFAQAVAKVREKLASKDSTRPAVPLREVFIKDGTRLVRVVFDDLILLKAEANYVEFVSTDSSVLSLGSIGKLEQQLPPEFIRAHRSYIVNVRHITKVEGYTLFLGKHSVPVGESYRDALLARLPVLR
jgi:two-component system, LytTR family, response regulator